MNLFYIGLIILILLLVIFNLNKENFKPLLYPSKDLYCEKRGYDKAYAPRVCQKGEYYDYYSLCRCQNKRNGDCTHCWSKINVDKKSNDIKLRMKKNKLN